MSYAEDVAKTEQVTALGMREARQGGASQEATQREYGARALWTIAQVLAIVADTLVVIHRDMPSRFVERP
jgi:hypothetical protein